MVANLGNSNFALLAASLINSSLRQMADGGVGNFSAGPLDVFPYLQGLRKPL